MRDRSLQSRSVEPELALAWTAHEVRAPLLGVRGAIERVLSRPGSLGPAERRLLRRSASELNRLSESVESLLALSLRPLVLNLERTNLTRLVREAVATCTVDGGSERVWVRAPAMVEMRADTARLRAAIANVVRNALSYSPFSTSVIIEIRTDETYASILVKDSGPGVDPRELEAIFRPFIRGSASESHDGLGVGLALAKQIAEAHGGTIVARNHGSSGAIFELRVRLSEIA